MLATSHLYRNQIWMKQFCRVDQKIANFMKSVNSKWRPIKIFKTLNYDMPRMTNIRKLKFGYVATINMLKSQTKHQQSLRLHG